MEPINIDTILKLIPHKYPILLIDRVISYTADQTITGIKNVTFNEPHFAGHFPHRPIMPGVLIVEAMAQLSAILIALGMNTTFEECKADLYFLSLERTKFRKPVQPGDTLVIESNLIQSSKSGIFKFSAIAKVDNIVATESTFTTLFKRN